MEKVGEMEENKRYGRSSRMRKEVMGCVRSMMGKNKFIVQFKDGQKKEKSSVFLGLGVQKRRYELI